MTAKNTTATAHSHRVFEVLQGLWPVTFDNVVEADPEGLLDIFEGSDSTRDRYFEAIAAANNITQAGHSWANKMSGFDTDHRDDCDQGTGAYKSSDWCNCKKQQWSDNQQWGQELWSAIQQRIQELNG